MGLLVLRSLRLLDMLRSSQRTRSTYLFREIPNDGTFATSTDHDGPIPSELTRVRDVVG